MKTNQVTFIRGFLASAMLALVAQIQTAAAVQSPTLPQVPSFRTSVVDVAQPAFELATPLPKVPAEVPLMATYGPDNPIEYLQDIALRLGLDKQVVRNGKGKVAVRTDSHTDRQRTLTGFEASGGFFYRFDKKLHAIPKAQPRLPDPSTAFYLATDYLTMLGILPKDAVLDPAAVTYHSPTLTEFDGATGKTLRSFRTGIEVRYPQTWGGVPVTGPGSKLYVAFSDGGEVVGVTHMWRTAEPTGETLPTVPPQQALKDLKVGSHLSVPVGCATAKIQRFELAYWAQSPREQQRIGLPLYLLQGECVSGKGESLGEFQGYAPAVFAGDFKLNDAPSDVDVDDAEQR